MTNTLIPNPGLYTDLYQLTMSQGYYKTGLHQKTAHFDYFFRNAPFDGEFVIFAGLSDLLSVLESYRFGEEDREWLESKGFDRDFCNFLGNYRFDAQVVSVREGEVVFPGEPVLTVSGSLLSCQLVETLLLNILNFQSLIATKAQRLRLAVGNKKLVDFGLRRGQGTGSIAASKAAAIGGFDATSNVLAGYRYDIPVSGTMAHSWIQCFENELDAFRKYAELYPDHTILLVDTYDSIGSGIPNAITVARELEEKGHRLVGIRLDSGNPLELSVKARTMLDEAGLSYVAITVSDQLDEKSLRYLVNEGAPIDLFGVGTRLIIGHPDGALSGVYKMCSLDGRPTMKYTDEETKSSLPGVKELHRHVNAEGRFHHDLIMLSNPDDPGNPDPAADSSADQPEKASMTNKPSDIGPDKTGNIRYKVMENGRALSHETDVRQFAEYVVKQIALLPDNIKRLDAPDCYDVRRDEDLIKLVRKIHG